jgi:hypothetical protein
VLELEGEEVAKANDLELQFYQDSVPLYSRSAGASNKPGLNSEIKQRFDMLKV